MNRLPGVMFGMVVATFCGSPALATDKDQSSSADVQQRELIYCADLMTPAEREAYRTSMRAARTPEERASLRQAHQKQMQARARNRGQDPVECEPSRQRERLRLRLQGDRP